MKKFIKEINFLILLLVLIIPFVLTVSERRFIFLSGDNENKKGFRYSFQDSSFKLIKGRVEKDLRFMYLLESHSECNNGYYSLKPATSKKFLSFSKCSDNKTPSFEEKPMCFKIDKDDNRLRNVKGQPVFYRKDGKLNLCIFGLDDFYVSKVNAFEIEKSNLLYAEVSKSIDTFQKNINIFNKNLKKNNGSSSSNDHSTEEILRIFESLNINNIN